MAQKIQTFFIDDIDGSEAEGTVRFGLDGGDYEIDLNAEHAEELRSALSPYVDAGRRITRTPPSVHRTRSRGKNADGTSTEEIRAWAKRRGYKVSDRGRIPEAITAEFKAAHRNSQNGTAPQAPAAAAEPKAEPKAEPEPATVKSGPAKRGGRTTPAAAKSAEDNGTAKAPAKPRNRNRAGAAASTAS